MCMNLLAAKWLYQPTDVADHYLWPTDDDMSLVVTALANGLFLFLSFFASLKTLLFVQLQKKKLSLTDGQRIISFLFLIICLTTTNRKFFWPTGDDMSTVVTAAANGLYQCHLQSLPLVICLTCYKCVDWIWLVPQLTMLWLIKAFFCGRKRL